MTETKKGTQRIYSLPVEQTQWKFDGDDRDPVQLGIRGRPRLAARSSTRRARSSSGTPARGSTGRSSSIPTTRWMLRTRRSRSTAPTIWNRLTDKERGLAAPPPAGQLDLASSCTASRAR